MRLKESINQNQINLLKATYGDIKKINPNSPAVKKLMMALKKLSKDDLETLSKAKINFVSTMAQSILRDSNVSESADIDNLQKRKNDLLKQVDPLIAKKKKLYSDVDITTPKSSDEKKLDKEIADLFSEINDLVHKIVKLKKSQNEGKHTMKLKSVNEAASVSHVRSTIEKVKKQLIQKWKQKGGYENFGEKEGRMLSDKFNTNPYGSSDERRIHSMIQDFENWAMNYDGKSESVNEADVNWNAVQNAIINFLKMNTKILDKKVQAKDTEGVKGGLKSIISGLTNAQRSLKLESVNEAVSKTFKIPTQRGMLHLEVEEDAAGIFVDVIFNKVDIATTDIQFPTGEVKITQRQKRVKLTESVKKSTFIKVARISNNGKLDIY